MATERVAPAPVHGPKLDCEQEVRFAVVMYGGVSLAIYINGVAQELLNMVRATAPAGEDGSTALPSGDGSGTGPCLRSSERVYRKVSYLLSTKDERMEAARRKSGETDEDLQTRLKSLRTRWLEEVEKALEHDHGEHGRGEPIRTRFIVDIISGTSAGGINGVFLAKALANGQQMDRLQQLWIDEGDIALLINDRGSVEAPYDLQQPPASLLNSQRMYVKLLKAMSGMETDDAPALCDGVDRCASPYVKELDLFVTTTDIQGLRSPIKLADSVVEELRYRNVFQFRYSDSENRNDFEKKYNPFLAYASRCTSSFPFAFEPMALSDVNEVLKNFRQYQDECYAADQPTWEKFYRRYVEPTGVQTRTVPFPDRAFGDGGYLDNKPFSYATETLARRVASVPVQRKLVYVEPSPEHPEDRPEAGGKPNVVDNALAALFTLPRYETIREDLQRVLERNRLITRIQRILGQVDTDLKTALNREAILNRDPDKEQQDKLLRFGEDYLAHYKKSLEQQKERDKPLSNPVWMKLDLADMAARKGRAYVAYHRLEIGVVTDSLAAMVATIFGYDEDSDYSFAVRSLLQAWRDDRYTEYHDHNKPTFNEFLLKLDMTYPLRQLEFVRDKINKSLRSKEHHHEARTELLSLRKFITAQYNILLDYRLKLAAGRLPQALLVILKNTGITEGHLAHILGADEHGVAPVSENRAAGSSIDQQEKECKDRARRLLLEHPTMNENLDHIGSELSKWIYDAREKSEDECLERLGARRVENTIPTSPAVAEIREQMREYYQNYDDFDMFIYPVQQGTDIGESALTEVTRISPEDATNLINEKKEGEECLKLAGTALGHFGAFLEASWRRNDILWGRLDGVERLIAALLPDERELAQQLTTEAQAAIVCETVERQGTDELYGLLVESLMRIKARRPAPETLSCFIEKLKSGATDAKTVAVFARIDAQSIRDYYLENFRTRSQMQPEPALRSAARATTVIGKMLEGLSNQYNHGGDVAKWVTRLGTVFWGMVEVAVPDSIFSKVFRHWLKLLYLFEALLIAAGIILPTTAGLRDFGWKALGFTIVLHGGVLLLGDIMQYRLQRWRVTKTLLVGAFALLVGLGVIELRHLLPKVAEELNNLRHLEISPRSLLQIGGLLSFMWLAVLTWMGVYFGALMNKVLKRQAASTGKKVENPGFMPWLLARTRDDIANLIGHRGDERREVVEESTIGDYFFIAIYWLLYLAMSRILYIIASNSQSEFPIIGMSAGKLALPLSIAAAVFGTVAAVSDIVENRRIMRLLGMPLNDAILRQAARLRHASTLKVAATCITLTTLAFTFWCRSGISSPVGWLPGVVGALFILGALVAAAGLIPRLHKILSLGFLIVAIGVLIVAIIFMFAPGWFLPAGI